MDGCQGVFRAPSTNPSIMPTLREATQMKEREEEQEEEQEEETPQIQCGIRLLERQTTPNSLTQAALLTDAPQRQTHSSTCGSAGKKLRPQPRQADSCLESSIPGRAEEGRPACRMLLDPRAIQLPDLMSPDSGQSSSLHYREAQAFSSSVVNLGQQKFGAKDTHQLKKNGKTEGEVAFLKIQTLK